MLERKEGGIIKRLKALPHTLKWLGRIGKPFTIYNSPQEKAHKIEQVLSDTHYGLTNHHIWGLMIRELGQLADGDRQKILDAYTLNKQDLGRDVSVAELMEEASGKRQGSDFFRNVAFNYDYALGAKERYKTAWQELEEKKRHSIHMDWEFWPLDNWVEMELVDGAHILGITRFDDFDRQTLERFEGYKLNYDSNYLAAIKGTYDKGFFRLLDKDQMVKAAFTKRMHALYAPPTLIYR